MKNSTITSMREIGISMSGHGFIEVVSDDTISWTNEVIEKIIGVSVSGSQINYIIPEDFVHDFSIFINNPIKKCIIPIKNSNSRISWFYCEIIKKEFGISWIKCSYITNTSFNDSNYIIYYSVSKEMINNIITYKKLEDIIHNNESRFVVMEEKLSSLNSMYEQVIISSSKTYNSARIAADSVMEVSQNIKKYKSEIEENLSKHTEEILKLISTDAHHDEEIKKFKENAKIVTDASISTIKTQTKEITTSVSKKIIIPISLISAIAAIFQFIINSIK